MLPVLYKTRKLEKGLYIVKKRNIEGIPLVEIGHTDKVSIKLCIQMWFYSDPTKLK